MRKIIWAIVAGVFLGTGTTGVCGTVDEIIIGVSTGYPPYYYEHNGELVGVCIELVNNVAQSLDLKITYKQYPWKRLLSNAQKGHVDAIMPLFKTQEREKYLYFSNLDLAEEENRFFSWKDKEIHFDGNFDSIRSFTVGVVSDYSYGEKFDRFEHFNKITTRDDKHLIEMFRYNRFDIGIGNKAVVLFNAKKENISQRIKFLAPYITKKPLYIGFSKQRNHSDLAKKFSDALQDFKSTDNYLEILNKYGMKK